MHDDLTSRSPKSYSVMAFRGTVLEAAVKRGRGRERERKKGKKERKTNVSISISSAAPSTGP